MPGPLIASTPSDLALVGGGLLLFLAVAASWAGVPAVGTLALTAAAVAASQGKVALGTVLVVATIAGEAGGMVGYAIGDRWGRRLFALPGKHHDGRARLLERGERAYARWGRFAVFFTPAIISGTARMRYGQFVVWNLVASAAFAVGVGASAYGLGRIVSGHHSGRDVAVLVAGLVIGIAVVVVTERRRKRRHASAADPVRA